MWEQVESRLSDLSRRAGLSGLPPAAVAAVAIVLGVAILAGAWRWWPRAEQAVSAPGIAGAPRTATAAEGAGGESGTESSSASAEGGADRKPASANVTVHVVGAVLHPGVYQLAADARVCDAVTAAGGLTGNAAQAAVNLARVVTDGEQIAVPTEDEYANSAAGPGPEGAAGAAAAGTGGSSGGKSAQASAAAQVNINTADATALDTLPGVGPSTAAKIVADREANGAFASPDDLGRVTGIGPKKLEQLKAYICVR